MYQGNIVEVAPTRELFEKKPLHHYTVALMAAIPSDDPDHELGASVLAGEATSTDGGNRRGCLFNPRCRYSDGDKCVTVKPVLSPASDERLVACHYPEKL